MKKFKVLLKLFWIFFKIGSFTFGGGLAMLPLIQKEVVNNQGWVNEDEILDIFAICQAVPGVIAINSAIFIGNEVAGIGGAIAAAMGVILPAFFSIILVLTALIGLKDNIYVEKGFAGIRAASTALILLSAIKLGKGVLKTKNGYIIGFVSLIMIVIINISAAWVIVLGGFVGYAGYLLKRRRN